MASRTLIYLIRLTDNHELVGAFSSKQLARTWAKRSVYALDQLELSAIYDGLGEIVGKSEFCREW